MKNLYADDFEDNFFTNPLIDQPASFAARRMSVQIDSLGCTPGSILRGAWMRNNIIKVQ